MRRAGAEGAPRGQARRVTEIGNSLYTVRMIGPERTENRLEVQLPEARRAHDRSRSARRGMTDESRREAWASRMASLILAVFILYILFTCVHLFSNIL